MFTISKALSMMFLIVMSTLAFAASATVPKDPIKVAFVLEPGATIIDFIGPMEVFQDVMMTPDGKPLRTGYTKDLVSPFEIYTVSEKKELITTSSGMKVMPDFTYADAPTPQIVLVPAERRKADARDAWLKRVAGRTDYMVSVCTGAFIFAQNGF